MITKHLEELLATLDTLAKQPNEPAVYGLRERVLEALNDYLQKNRGVR